ncbi:MULTISPECIES: helix-turn-helix transcriptional regulator [Glycomyces]|uniref:DNA-binding NarL/FixJ family response regulator n=2 Tax=Glycomyces TaxID=58113 RepID=A0A9X3SUI1_9ACTN|nr:response regulator transcription factor [Glycomyces lechevalierae]MDA1385560.1 response regulator transcription factor [Glycomyces lechevalierae]MDR7339603.1 DNA-binding NarL/FixJ family response regulator [Glycomyces lechevalierae]
MRTVLVCVKTPQAGQKISACATRMGLAQAVKSVEGSSELFLELGRRQVDVVLVDVALAAPDPVKFVKTVRARSPRTGVLLSGAADPRTAAMVVAAGARGVIRTPSNNCDDLLVALAQAIMFASPTLQRVTETVPRQRSTLQGMKLTERELQVLRGMSEGKSNAEIGRDLFVSEDTVKTHARRMFRKLGARDRAHAVAEAFRSGLVC